MSVRTKLALAAAAAAVLAAVPFEPAAAQTPITPAPPSPYVNTTKCVQAANERATLKSGVSWAQSELNYTALWRLGDRGEHQTIAVIDTGVSPVSAFSGRLLDGGDFVKSGGNGQDDCDGHGTVVAGLAAAQPDSTTGFAGVAPDARVLPIRQSSSYFGVKDAKPDSPGASAGTTGSLASAIVYAVQRGATVINISEASCRNPSEAADPRVQAAVDYAVANRVVVVAAAGNVDQTTQCKQQNVPGKSPVTLPTPAELHGVLAVGAVDRNGAPAAFSLSGRWVGVAAPGVDIISTNPIVGSTGQINEFINQAGVTSIQGTSFAAPYVAGLAALVSERFPNLDALGIISRIERTAEHPSDAGGRNDYVGYGTIDPEAALTAVLPGEGGSSPVQRHGPSALPAAQPHPDHERNARLVALIGTLGLFVLGVAAAIAVSTRRRRTAVVLQQATLRSGGGTARRGW